MSDTGTICLFYSKNILLDGSGTGALINVLTAIDCKDKNVLLPAMTCPNVAIAVYAAGAIPVYADIDLKTGNMDMQQLRKNIDEQTCAIIAVHSFGYPLDISSIREEHKNHIIIEDACQAYGGFVGSQPLGTFGDIGIISFGYAKPIAAGQGAAIIIIRPHAWKKYRDILLPEPPLLQSQIKQNIFWL